jgi:hypothetical protein
MPCFELKKFHIYRIDGHYEKNSFLLLLKKPLLMGFPYICCMEILDILIIGGGPIGLNCALEAQKNNLSYRVIEKGTIVNSLYNYPLYMRFFSTAEKLEIDGIPLFQQLQNREDRKRWNIIRELQDSGISTSIYMKR